jgi:hypothetical protein
VEAEAKAEAKAEALQTNFDATLESQDVIVSGTAYEVREMLGVDSDAYMDLVKDRAEFNADGKLIKVLSFDGVYSALLVRCMFVKKTGEKVTPDVVGKWPTRVQRGLYKLGVRINGIAEKSTEVAGKKS